MVKVDPTGRFAYVPDTGNGVVWAYTIDRSTGALTPVSGSPFAAGPISLAEIYDPVAGTWSATGSMTIARDGHTATLLSDGKMLVAGGFWYSAIADAETFDPVAGTWAIDGPLVTARYSHTATLLPYGTVLITGGST